MATPTLQPEQFARAAECLRTLSHPVRLHMVDLLLRGRYTVNELAESCGIRQHVASEHLRRMQDCQLLNCEREGRKAYYVIAEPGLSAIMACVHTRFGGPSATP